MANCLKLLGAWGRTLTGTALRPRDFKSLASTRSATQAGDRFYQSAMLGWEMSRVGEEKGAYHSVFSPSGPPIPPFPPADPASTGS